MYRIMLVKSKKSNYASLYTWLTEMAIDDNGAEVAVPVEFETEELLDEKVESMLNDEGYAKEDFIVVKLINYTITAQDYTD